MDTDSISDILRKEANLLLEESKQFNDYATKRNKIIDSIICYEESIKSAKKQTEHFKALKNLCIANITFFRETIKYKQNDLEGLYNICLELIKNFQKIEDNEMDNQIELIKDDVSFFVNEIINRISDSKEISEEEKLPYFYQLNSILLWKIPEAKDKLTQKILNQHLIRAINYYEQKDYVKSQSELNLGLILGKEREKYSSIIVNYNEEDENLKALYDYMLRIQFFLCIDKSDQNLKKGLFDSEEMEMERIYIAIETCREAIQISEAIVDKEIECIAFSRLLKIYHRIHKIEIKVRQIINHLKSLLDSLSYKNFKGQEWYDQSIKIIEIIEAYDANYDNEIETSRSNKKIEISDIQKAFNVSKDHFIKFIFKNYSPSDIPTNFNVHEATIDLKEKINIIIQIFFPNKAKDNPEEYLIHNEILKFLNRISDEFNKEKAYENIETSAD